MGIWFPILENYLKTRLNGDLVSDFGKRFGSGFGCDLIRILKGRLKAIW